MVSRIAPPIDQALQRRSPRAAVTETRTYKIDSVVRDDIRHLVERLYTELTTDNAIVEAWHDLVSSAQNLRRTVEDVSFRRDTLHAIAQRRNLDIIGSFGLFGELSALVSDVANAVHEEIQRESGGEFEPCDYPPGTPSGVPMARRLQLCEQLLSREPERGDCIVWLKVAPASLPQLEVTHGQVTFYNGVHLSGLAGSAEHADRFVVPPLEVLTMSPDEGPILQEGQVLWEYNPNIVYARVVLPDIEVHTSDAKARALVEGLIAVNHAMKDSWKVADGSVVFVDGECRSMFFYWGSEDDIPPVFVAQNDRTGRDIEVMEPNNRRLNAQSLHDLQDAIGMSTALKTAVAESPQATVMAAVRAIEHVNAWTTGGVDNWARFASYHFKKAQCQGWLIQLLDRFTLSAIHSRGDLRGNVTAQQEVFKIESEMKQFKHDHQRYDRRVAADKLEALERIFIDHWLSRGLGELKSALSSPTRRRARLEEHGRRFDLRLSRLKRLRNAAIHGGPVSDSACESVAGFASDLAHRCLDQAMKALLTGIDIEPHMTGYRAESLARYELVCTTGTVDDMFVPGDIEPGDD